MGRCCRGKFEADKVSMKNPHVLISIPTLNSSYFLEKCLKAIDTQTYKNISVNIVDGGSTDETISIAKKYGVSIQALRQVNNLNKRSVLKVGARLKIPGAERTGSEARQKTAPISKKKVHVVRRGENLSVIAEKYQIPLSALKQSNELGRGAKIMVGTRLLIPTAMAR